MCSSLKITPEAGDNNITKQHTCIRASNIHAFVCLNVFPRKYMLQNLCNISFATTSCDFE